MARLFNQQKRLRDAYLTDAGTDGKFCTVKKKSTVERYDFIGNF